MAWVTPSARTTGDLITAAIWNQDAKDNPIELRTGGIAIAAQAALDFIYASSATQFGRVGSGAALQSIRRNAANTAWEFHTPATVYEPENDPAWAYVMETF